MKKYLYLILFLSLLVLPSWALARIGVGVATGKIEVDQPLRAGLIYNLPPLAILNTGDEPSDYGVGLQWRQDQSELKPEAEWFSFEPQEFYLEPGQSQLVQIKLTLPVKGVVPGDYFAFLQGFPLKKADSSGTSIGVAAAAKLYFSVEPSNFLFGLYYRFVSMYQLYTPYTYIVSVVLLGALLLAILRRFVSFNIGLSFKKNSSKK